MIAGLEIDFSVTARASCRDCGAEVPKVLELRGRVRPATADSDANGLVNVDAPGACKACGGGRIAVTTSFGVDAQT